MFPLTQVQHGGHCCQGEADGVHGHTPHQGWLVLIRVGVAEEGEDDTRHKDLQPLEQAYEEDSPVWAQVQTTSMA